MNVNATKQTVQQQVSTTIIFEHCRQLSKHMKLNSANLFTDTYITLELFRVA